jgi:hypothetical protein
LDELDALVLICETSGYHIHVVAYLSEIPESLAFVWREYHTGAKKIAV